MAYFDSGERSSVTGLLVTGQTLLMVAFTLVETVALGVWLALVEGAPVVSTASAVGIGALTVGLVLEHVLTDATINGLSVSIIPDGQILGVSLSEALLWAVWLGVAEEFGGVDGILIAGVVLALLLVPQHTIEDNVLRDADPFESVLDLGTVGFSVVEAVGATVWLLLVFESAQFSGLLAAIGLGGIEPAAVGLGALAVVLFIEHDIGVALARRG